MLGYRWAFDFCRSVRLKRQHHCKIQCKLLRSVCILHAERIGIFHSVFTSIIYTDSKRELYTIIYTVIVCCCCCCCSWCLSCEFDAYTDSDSNVIILYNFFPRSSVLSSFFSFIDCGPYFPFWTVLHFQRDSTEFAEYFLTHICVYLVGNGRLTEINHSNWMCLWFCIRWQFDKQIFADEKREIV